MSYLHMTESPFPAKTNPPQTPMTISRLHKMRELGEKIAALTCYDASFAALMDNCGVDIILVGDSLGNVIQGHSTTIPVTLEALEYHTRCVVRGNKRAYLIADMPFGTYATPEQAYTAAAQLMRAGAHMVKLEGGEWLLPTVRFLVERGIPVCAHLGLLPQSVHALGGFKVQGKNIRDASRLKGEALAIQAAGAHLLVLEAIPATLAGEITNALHIPTIGIGASNQCSGQILVLHDMLGLSPDRAPRFVKNFMETQNSISGAISAYITAVKSGEFPAAEHCF